MLFLWKLSQEGNYEYDSYDSAIVAANSPEEARRIHPARYSDTDEQINYWDDEDECWRSVIDDEREYPCRWVSIDQIKVVCVGKAAAHIEHGTVICSSFNAG